MSSVTNERNRVVLNTVDGNRREKTITYNTELKNQSVGFDRRPIRVIDKNARCVPVGSSSSVRIEDINTRSFTTRNVRVHTSVIYNIHLYGVNHIWRKTRIISENANNVSVKIIIYYTFLSCYKTTHLRKKKLYFPIFHRNNNCSSTIVILTTTEYVLNVIFRSRIY